MRRLALSAGAVVVALVLQLTLVDRLPLPGGGAPDLVLLVVVALGLTGGPMAGMLTGFWAGLALDVAPPASYLIGEHALVFCVVGYACGRLSGMIDRSAVSSLGIAAVAAAGGEVLQVMTGLMLGDPGVSWLAIRSVLPSSVLQDILVSPFVLYLVLSLSSQAAGHPHVSPAGGAAAGPQPGSPGAGRADGMARRAGPGLTGSSGWLAGPRSGRGRKAGALGSLRFGRSAARPGDGWVGSGQRAGQASQARARRPRKPRLRPGAGQAGSAVALQARRQRPARPVSIRMGTGRHGDGSLGTALRSGIPGQRRNLGAAGRPRHPTFRLGGGSPGGSAVRSSSSGLGGAGLGSRERRGAAGRPVSLRLPGRRGDGAVGSRSQRSVAAISSGRGLSGGFAGGRGPGGRLSGGGLSGGGLSGGGLSGGTARAMFRPSASRAARRFGHGPGIGGPAAGGRQPRFSSGRRSVLARLTRRRPATRLATPRSRARLARLTRRTSATRRSSWRVGGRAGGLR